MSLVCLFNIASRNVIFSARILFVSYTCAQLTSITANEAHTRNRGRIVSNGVTFFCHLWNRDHKYYKIKNKVLQIRANCFSLQSPCTRVEFCSVLLQNILRGNRREKYLCRIIRMEKVPGIIFIYNQSVSLRITTPREIPRKMARCTIYTIICCPNFIITRENTLSTSQIIISSIKYKNL